MGVREISSRPDAERWELARDLLGLRITLTILGGIVMTAIAWAAYSATLAAGVALATTGLLLQATQDNYSMALLVDLRLGWVSVLELGRQILTTAGIGILVLGGAHLLAFFGVSIPVGLILVLLAALLVRRTRSLRPRFDPARWRAFAGQVVPYALAVAAAALYFRVSILLVSAFGSAHELGDFSASFRIIEVLTLVPGLVAGSALPIFARAAGDDRERLGYALERVHEVALLVGAWIAVSVAIAAPLVIKIIGGSEFRHASPVLALQGIGLGAMFVSAVWGNGLLSLSAYRDILVITLGALVLNVVLVSVLIAADGDRGAALGTAIAEIAAACAQAAAVVRHDPRLRPSLRSLPRVALAAGLALVPLALRGTGVPTIALLALSTLIFAVMALALRLLPHELRDLLPGRLAAP